MKRRKIIILTVFLAFILFLGFMTGGFGGRRGLPWKTTESSEEYYDANSDISFSVDEKTLERIEGNLEIKNDSDKEIYFSQEYILQIKIDNIWYDITPDEPEYKAEFIFVQPQNSYSFHLNDAYGRLPVGDYRIIKEYSAGSVSSYMTAEFKVR